MKSWIGKSMIIVGVIHSIFGLAVFSSTVFEVFGEGLFNTVNGQPMREWVFWFMFFGFLLIILGWLVDWCERASLEFPKYFGWAIILFTTVVVFIMPISGGWMMFIPSLGLMFRKK